MQYLCITTKVGCSGPNAGSMSGQRLRLCPDIEPALGRRFFYDVKAQRRRAGRRLPSMTTVKTHVYSLRLISHVAETLSPKKRSSNVTSTINLIFCCLFILYNS